MNKSNRIIMLGTVDGSAHQRDRVYAVDGIAPAVNGSSCQGGYNNQPRILIEYE